jgi:uncharacterized membrane protein
MRAQHDSLPIFRRVLRPHRSAESRKAPALIAAVALVLLATGAAFWAAGAWPVLGFIGLEVVLFGAALNLNHRSARACEMIALTERELTVRRIDSRGRGESWSFQPYWLRVGHDPANADAPIELSSHGRSVAVGGFLAPAERRELADALRSALAPLSGIAEIAAWPRHGRAGGPLAIPAQASPRTSRME